MKLFKGKSKNKNSSVNSSISKEFPNVKELMKSCQESDDFFHYEHLLPNGTIWISYYKNIIDVDVLHKGILEKINDNKIASLQQIQSLLPIEKTTITTDIKEIKKNLLNGHIVIQLKENAKEVLLINAPNRNERSISPPEVEFSVVGPKEAFVESIDTNLNLLRHRFSIPELKVKELTIGSLSKTKIAVIYIEGITNQENVNTVLQRVKEIEFDQLIDSSYLTQMISDNPKSLFPQLLDTERPDRAASVLAEGKVVIMVNGSPHALIAPTNLTEFFSSFEDYFLNPILASAFRIIRFVAVIFSFLVTPIYVAVLTYHYELIPKDLLGTLITSREVVPLPPILEALILELTIELLREAGARLPTKVGQTIGIVGGIVIGTASVEAGLTSNVLLILIGLAALASFTTPVYQMGNTIRLIRFPFLLFAYLFGMLGIVLCFCFLLGHLLRLTSLGRPFLEPLYPPRIEDLKDSVVRFPFSRSSKRPINLQTENTIRFQKWKARQKKDIDE